MELDDIRTAWQAMDQRLQQQAATTLQLDTNLRLDSARRRLRPLQIGQIAQLILGLLLAILFARFWVAHTDSPAAWISGLLMHAWSLLLVISAINELVLIQRIDYAKPVLEIQKALARLHNWRTRVAPWLGLPFWLLWIPLLEVILKGSTGVGMDARMWWWGIPVGVVGLVATLAFFRWSQHPSRRHLGATIDAGNAGRGVTEAQAMLDEIARFERD